MIRKIAVVAAAFSLLLTGAAEADGSQAADCDKTCVKPLYPPEPPPTKKIVKVVKTAERVEKIHTVDRVHTVSAKQAQPGQRAVAARQKGALPKTGADSLPLTQIGAGLLAVGAVLVLIERNRRAARAEHVDLS